MYDYFLEGTQERQTKVERAKRERYTISFIAKSGTGEETFEIGVARTANF